MNSSDDTATPTTVPTAGCGTIAAKQRGSRPRNAHSSPAHCSGVVSKVRPSISHTDGVRTGVGNPPVAAVETVSSTHQGSPTTSRHQPSQRHRNRPTTDADHPGVWPKNTRASSITRGMSSASPRLLPMKVAGPMGITPFAAPRRSWGLTAPRMTSTIRPAAASTPSTTRKPTSSASAANSPFHQRYRGVRRKP
ncbi:hypothetical protein SDC9_114485 [bioreactor metagenome]|uniref:Uncharacterized protein n=1 Tax=bioreactor metagenome TaxID=1076179 RepID=A0A645BQS8_9ZZZZ